MALRYRLSLLVASLALLGVLAAGCGASDRSEALPILGDLTLVANATDRADSARFEMEMATTMPGFGGELSFGAAGAFDTPGQKAELSVDLGSFAELLGGFAKAFGGTTEELPDAEDWKLEVRVDGTTMYMRFPLMAKELPAGKSWVKVDLTKLPGGATFEQMQAFTDSSDPRAMLSYLRSLSDGLEVVGTEDVRGVPTTHYRANLDVAKALQEAARQAKKVKGATQTGMFDQLQSMAGLETIPVDVWVDGDNLLRKLVVSFSAAPDGGQGKLDASMKMEMFDYGETVVIETPPADETVDARDVPGFTTS